MVCPSDLTKFSQRLHHFFAPGPYYVQKLDRKNPYGQYVVLINKRKPRASAASAGRDFFLPEIQEASKILPAEIPITPLGIPIIPKDSLRLLKSP